MTDRIAKLCYEVKQHIANQLLNNGLMAAEPINDVLATNLAHFMAKRGLTQAALACGAPDHPSNMQWQTVADAKEKDKWERRGCYK